MAEYKGAAPGVRELSELIIEKVSVGPGDNNCYLLRCRATGKQLMIDAASEPEKLLELCDGHLDAAVTTHQHWDHWQNALPQVVAATGARTYAGAPDAPAIAVPTDVPLRDGDVIPCGEFHVLGNLEVWTAPAPPATQIRFPRCGNGFSNGARGDTLSAGVR